MAVMNC